MHGYGMQFQAYLLYLDAQAHNVRRFFMSTLALILSTAGIWRGVMYFPVPNMRETSSVLLRAAKDEEKTRAVPRITSESVFLDRLKGTMNQLYVVVMYLVFV